MTVSVGQRLSKAVSFALLCWLLVTPGAAQQNNAVVADIAAFMLDWQVWLWRMGEAAPVQVTDFADEWRVGSISVSPDGRYIAFQAYASLEEPRQYPGYTLDTLWLYDVTTENLLQIDALDPTQAGYTAGRYILSAPRFAPDSSELFWLEVDWETDSRMIFYDLQQQTRRSLPSVANWGYQDGGDVALPYLQWGDGGLLNTVGSIVEAEEVSFHQFIEVIDPFTADKQVFDVWQEDMGDDQQVRDVMWAYASAEAITAQVIAFQRGADWYTLDPADATITRYSGAPTTTLPNFTVIKDTQTRDDSTTFTVRSLATPSGEPVALPAWITGFAVSTGGAGVLFLGPEAIGMWQAGSTHLFNLPPDPDPADNDPRFGNPAGAEEQVRFVNVEPLESSVLP